MNPYQPFSHRPPFGWRGHRRRDRLAPVCQAVVCLRPDRVVHNVSVIRLRAASPGDERRLAFLDRATWSPAHSQIPWWDESVDFFASDPVENVIVADSGGTPVGYVKLRRITEGGADLPELTIGGIAVEPERQRQGIDGRLVAEAVEEATGRGAERVSLHVLGTNAAAFALYKSHGFEVAEVRSGAFLIHGDLVDDLVMERRLILTAGNELRLPGRR